MAAGDVESASLSVLVAPNEDGFGPSSLAFHLVHALLRRLPNCRIILRTGTKVDYNKDLYADTYGESPATGRVSINRVHNIIQLKTREDGRIDPIASLEGLLRYPALRRRYLNESLHGAELAIELGVPALAHAAAEQGVPCFTVFDHSWSLTFDRILLEHRVSELSSIYSDLKPREEILRAMDILASDEARTRRVFLFRSPLTSADYWKHWARLCNDDQISDINGVSNIGGVLGGPSDDSFRSWENEARRILHLPPGDKAILVSAGGTPIWHEVLPRLVEEYARETDLPYHVYVFAPAPVRKRISKLGDKLSDGAPPGGKRVEQWSVAGSSKVHVLGEAWGCTYQAIISGVSLVVSRAGGATVNDALACAVPLLLVPEPGHWQVDTIHKATIDEGYGVSLPYREFIDQPAAAVHRRFLSLESLWQQIRDRMSTNVKRGCEVGLVERILEEAKLSGPA